MASESASTVLKRRLCRNRRPRDWRSVGRSLWRHASGRARVCLSVDRRNPIGLSLRAVSADMSGLLASVASLTRRVQWPAVWSSAVSADMSELAAGVALHGLSLAIASKMVGSAALVARCRAVCSGEATAKSASVASSWWSSSSTSDRCCVRGWAVALDAC